MKEDEINELSNIADDLRYRCLEWFNTLEFRIFHLAIDRTSHEIGFNTEHERSCVVCGNDHGPTFIGKKTRFYCKLCHQYLYVKDDKQEETMSNISCLDYFHTEPFVLCRFYLTKKELDKRKREQN